MPRFAFFRRFVLVATLVLPLLAASAVLAGPGPQEPQLTSAIARELWRKGSDQILSGDFTAAATTLEQVQNIEPGHTEVADAIQWMRDAESLARSREDLRVRNYDHFVAEAKKAAEEARKAKGSRETAVPDDAAEGGDSKGDKEKKEPCKWSKALDFAQAAMANAKSEETFREEPWLKEIVEHTLGEIDEYKQENKWRDALALYALLQEIYPKSEDYKKGFDFCRKRAHLDFVYGPKSEWRTALQDVTADAVSEILQRIDEDYVKPVDFKKLCIEGLEHVRLLAEAKSLTQAFPTLGDDDLVNSFVNRLDGLVKRRIEPASKFGPREVAGVFDKMLEANRDSLRLPENVLVDEFVAGLMEPLDEFTAVIWPAEVPEFNKHTRGKFVGVGIQITQPEGQHVRVESPLEDSPAYWAGVKPGDLITEVDGASTLDMTVTEAVRRITGEPGTQVTLTMQDGLTGETRKITLTRKQIEIQTVRGFHRDEAKPTGWDYFIDADSSIGYIAVTGFMDKTVEDLESVLKQLRKESCRGIILDLRFNPGGLLTSAVQMCELFMDANQPVVQTKGRSRSQNSEIRSRFKNSGDNAPLIVMVNEYSASASEIVAGALSGLKGACIVGTRTFGKGSVQNLIPIEDGQAYLKLTTARYYVYDADLAEWYLLHREEDSESWGVEPHIIVKVIPQELNKILRLRRERELLKGKDQTDIPKEVLERRPTTQPNLHLQQDDDPDTDPQLVTALNIMRIKLMSSQPWVLAPRHDRAVSQANASGKIGKTETR